MLQLPKFQIEKIAPCENKPSSGIDSFIWA